MMDRKWGMGILIGIFVVHSGLGHTFSFPSAKHALSVFSCLIITRSYQRTHQPPVMDRNQQQQQQHNKNLNCNHRTIQLALLNIAAERLAPNQFPEHFKDRNKKLRAVKKDHYHGSPPVRTSLELGGLHLFSAIFLFDRSVVIFLFRISRQSVISDRWSHHAARRRTCYHRPTR
jgi:hypothetical protein